MKINIFISYFLLLFSFLCSFYLIRSDESLYLIFYSLFLIILSFFSLYYLQKSNPREVYSFIFFFKYLIIFFVLDFFLQAFYHKIELNRLLIHLASSFSAILSIFVFSKVIENENDFLKINRFIFYLLNLSLVVGIIDSLEVISINFLAPKKLIAAYNFGIFKNTAGLMEHPISFGIAGALLFVISILLNKISLKNFHYLLLIFLGVFISFSRTGFLLLFICFLVFIFQKKILPKVFFMALFFGFLISIFFIDFYEIELINQIFRLDSGFTGREFIVGFFFSIPFDLNQLLFGLGYQNIFEIRDSLLTDFELKIEKLQFSSLHNLYLSTTLNSGLLLSIIYFTSQFKIYYQYIKLKSKFSNHILMVMLIFILGNLFVEFRVGGIRIISLYFSIILAFIFKDNQTRKFK